MNGDVKTSSSFYGITEVHWLKYYLMKRVLN